MRRRDFLRFSALTTGAGLVRAYGLDKPSHAAPLRLTIDPHQIISTIEPDFTGLSYESQQLGDPTFFSPDNKELAGLVRRLGTSGVLRIGGSTSDYAYWTPNPAATPARSSGPVNPFGVNNSTLVKTPITPKAIENLRGFLDATGWKLIYGLNLGTGTAEAAAAETAYVMDHLGSKIVSFQMANEPDTFSFLKVRKQGYDYADFAQEWEQFYKVIHAKVPNAPFSGPDTAFQNAWLTSFAEQFHDDILFLSQHYYAEGPPSDPAMTIERLLQPNTSLKFGGLEIFSLSAELATAAEARRKTGLPFRLTETNSCFSGGKQGVSNTFASALWGAELMFQLAAHGGTGINFHGGGYGWYTPIAGTQAKGFTARPIYYGMLLFAETGAGHLVASRLSEPQPEDEIAAYSVQTDAGLKTVLFNKSSDSARHIVIDPGMKAERATMLALTGPSLAATSGVKLGGVEVDSSGQWQSPHRETIPLEGGHLAVNLPAASAALVSFEV